MSEVNVEIQAITALQSVLRQFGDEIKELLHGMEQKIDPVRDWLENRRNYWRQQESRAKEEVVRANGELMRCMASGFRDQQGYHHAPDCSDLQRKVEEAKRRLLEAENELRKVYEASRAVDQAFDACKREANRLTDFANIDLDRAKAFLGQRVDRLESYTAESPPPGPAMSPEFREGNSGGPERLG